jgi:hypothetical protein
MQRNTTGTWKGAIALVLICAALVLQPAVVAKAQVSEAFTRPPTEETGDARLERIWLHQQRSLHRLEFMFDHSQQRLQKAQELIDVARDRGKDVRGLQTALDAFSAALQEARSTYESAVGIVDSHKGFDDQGEVVDSTLAAATVEDMAEKLSAVRDTLLEPGRDLRDAIRDYRRANRP